MKRIDEIKQRLNADLKPSYIEIEDESHQHSGPRVESHFRVLVVSDEFVGLTRVARQKRVYALVDDLFAAGLHAFSLRTLTKEEWDQLGQVNTAKSPECAHKSSK